MLNPWFDWGFWQEGSYDWTTDDRYRTNSRPGGSPQKFYGSDGMDVGQVIFDNLGAQATPDADTPSYYTLNGTG